MKLFELWKFVPSIEYVYADVPPEAVKDICPEAFALQVRFVGVAESVKVAGSVKVTVVVAKQALASLTVRVLFPAERPVKVFELWKFVPSIEYE